MFLPYFFFTAVSLVLSVAGNSNFDPLKHLAGITLPSDSDAATSSLDQLPPRGCNVTRAAYLMRHGAIHSNDYEFKTYIKPFLMKLAKTPVNWSASSELKFLSTWRNPILSENRGMLSRTGKLQAMTAGVEIAQRYYYLRTPKKIWSASSNRTYKTATFFKKGLENNGDNIKVVDIYEGKKQGANSLSPYDSCPAYHKSDGSESSLKFLEIYTKPIITRFNKLVPGFNFTSSDIYTMSLICGYETVLRGSSPFCDLSVMSPNEWLGFEYTNDIKYFYNSGYGSPLSGAIGFPWLNATVKTLMSDHDTQSDKVEDQDIFISFTHRQLIPMVLVSMGLFNNSAYSGSNKASSTMPLNTINHQRVWKSSQIIPFMTDIGLEKLECDSHDFDKGIYYRVLLNNNPLSIPDCHDGPSESCKESSLAKWLLNRAKVVGDFDTTCKVNYNNSSNILTIYNDSDLLF
ncbi:Acid phosphatase PHO1 [Erysiphe neolycopersici]|uniref:Acid phosphatase PHO1 n=1 Tax=Erysiphe neolycopersici TaxID=212602 RepID=A0A420HGI2_9PEZI|nr:Acid phosphatase PHO1 [Erysiphe neolycopersici]